MPIFIPKSKLPVTVYYSGKHVSCVFEDLRKMKAPNIRLITSLLTIIIKVSKVLLIKEDPKAALNREHG
jgi:hypothetical protein